MKTLALVSVVLLLAAEVFAQQTFTGRIKGRVVTDLGEHPIEQVSIEVHKIYDAAQTDQFGRFEVDLPKITPDWSRDRKRISLVFSKKGFEDVNRVIDCEGGHARECENLTIAMVRAFDDSELDPQKREGLKGMVSKDGLSLYLMPYDIVRESDASPVPGPSTEMLMQGLHISINTHLQALSSPLPEGTFRPPVIGVKSIKDKMSVTDTEKIHNVGLYLNALAMIGGSGEIRMDESGKDIAEVSSFYTTIASLQGFPSIEVVQDKYPAKLFNPVELSKRLNSTWGYQTAFALCLTEFKRAKSKGDRKGLEQVRAYLLAERSQLERNYKGLSQIQEMLKLVEKELQQ